MKLQWLAGAVLVATAGAAEKAPVAGAPSYAKEVSRIVQKRCEGCHRPGQIGPFSLTNYEEVSAFAPEIKKATQSRKMPPWHAVPGYGEFKNERRLSDAEIDTIARWADAGAPRGDMKLAPAPVKYSDDWALGPPDAVITPDVSFDLEPSGDDEYRCFVAPTSYAEDRTIQAIEVRPGNRKVVHHVLIYTDLSGKARQLDAADPRPGFSCFGGLGFLPNNGLGGWAPGAVPGRLPEDIGRFLAKGADVIMQVHYHKNGRRETDRSSLGFYFNPRPAKRFLRSQPVANLGIKIPAGAEQHRETASWTLRNEILAYAATPHMHLLGKEMRMIATLPDGATRDLVWVKNYDFNWQTSYVFKEPILLPAGARIDVTAYYDNSEKNPSNPSKPLRDVRWGEGTTDEMLIGWLAYITDNPTARR
ncbi:MAG: ascorbate-dependent monooxygenase [Candidatus Solibacter usitatus]|nr:ascorbate-dependent monooxygenase [Candidatus Solibacter usitatus]